jgi:hypothetical protein
LLLEINWGSNWSWHAKLIWMFNLVNWDHLIF